ncbi:MAG: alpha/beta hydrolase [Spirochaetia bacterium]|nr:alpha/beta hydrolase [Spirochaetia bacterium]
MKKIFKTIAAIFAFIVLSVVMAEIYDLYLSGEIMPGKSTNVIVKNQKVYKNISEFTFPVGYETFHENESLNFLLNRTYSMGYARKEDMVLLGKRLGDRDQWQSEMIKAAEEALADNRILNAAFYYRIAEFYTPWEDPDKDKLHHLFIKYFYRGVDTTDIETARIPYGGSYITSMKVKPKLRKPKGTIILHAGYDGFKEEMFSTMKYFSSQGYAVISFECPWMIRGEEKSKIPFTYKWEKIISPIIDHYQLEEVTLIGFSFGGWLALRAAAFEPRIKKVAASSVSFDVNQYPNVLMQIITSLMMKNRDFVNTILYNSMEDDIQQDWFFSHLMHMTHTSTPYDASKVLSEINERNLHSHKIKQDVLILTGKDDRLVPYKMHNMQVKALVNANSIIPLVFTADVQAGHHCQVGNIELALSSIMNWMNKIE